VAVKSSAKHKKILFLFWGLNRLNFLIFIAYSFRDASQEPLHISREERAKPRRVCSRGVVGGVSQELIKMRHVY
jgi:hypothetical protein